MTTLPRLLCLLVLLAIFSPAASAQTDNQRPPNIIIVFTDDQGFGDLSCFGNPSIHTPNIDHMASEGMKLTNFYVASPVCSPSRAALLTGCYPIRVGMQRHVIFPQYDYGLHTDEQTIADMLHDRGYATACFGKWHLGHRPGLMPTDQGFDTYFGTPYSNDMSTFHRPANDNYRYNLPLMRGNEVVEWEPDQTQFTRQFTEAAVQFIDEHHEEPFFIYLPHPMPHIPIYASEAFLGTSARGLYGDVIEEIDWSVGQLLASLQEHGIDDNTLVIFTTDNGPWTRFRENGGSAGPLRGSKGTNWEGGQRVPCVVRWPGHVPAGTVCRELTRSIDLLPTIAQITGGELSGNTIDGGPITGLLMGEPDAQPASDTFLYYTSRGELAGIRRGDMKLLFAGPEGGDGPFLFNVQVDISEEWDLAAQNPDMVNDLRTLAIDMNRQITENARPVRTVEQTLWEWPHLQPNAQGQ